MLDYLLLVLDCLFATQLSLLDEHRLYFKIHGTYVSCRRQFNALRVVEEDRPHQLTISGLFNACSKHLPVLVLFCERIDPQNLTPVSALQELK